MDEASTSQTAIKWTPSVFSYFKVVFQKMNQPTFQASFLEVDGLSWEMSKKTYRGNDGSFQTVPRGLTYTNLVLKRPVGPLSGSLTKWIKECH